MGAELVNLRRFRKRKARQQKEETAQANRIAFGRSKSEKAQTRLINDKAARTHEGGRLESPAEGSAKQPK